MLNVGCDFGRKFQQSSNQILIPHKPRSRYDPHYLIAAQYIISEILTLASETAESKEVLIFWAMWCLTILLSLETIQMVSYP